MSQYLIENDTKCDYSFRAITLTSFLVLLVLLVLTGKGKGKGKMVNGCCEGLRSKGYGRYKCMLV